MKKIGAVFTAVILVTALSLVTGCGSKNDKLLCGVTVYEPMDYKNPDGTWTGFDADFARLVGGKIGMKVEFVEINWDSKYMELQSGAINCIWNGFTANDTDDDGVKRSDKVDFSYSYMLNEQCVVVKAANAASYTDVSDLTGKTAAAEKGSSGEGVATDSVGETGKVISSDSQIATFIEVKSGAVDCAVVDILLAKSLIGTGSYSDLAIADIAMPSEVYAVGFKKGSPLRDKVNAAIKELYDDGSLADLAAKYGLENSLLVDTSFTG